MAAELADPDMGRKRKRTRSVCNGRFGPGDQVEVKSEEDGFHGSWHPGTVIKCGSQVCHVRYNNCVIRNGVSHHLTEKVKVSAFANGTSECNDKNKYDYSKLIRLKPPPLEVGVWDLKYGLCVDVLHTDIWWEGVVFDHKDGTKERRIFFPDLGDEMIVQIDAIRITQDWSEVSKTCQRRGTWLFLELLEDKSLVLTVSVKQIWYDVRLKEGFQKIGLWTSKEKDLWMELIKEVIEEQLIIFFNFVMQPISDGCTDTVIPFISSIDCKDFGKWIDVEPDMSPGAEFDPDAVTGYASAYSTGNRKLQNLFKTKVRMHLSYLGWKMEYKRDATTPKHNPRFRYISPLGNIYHSLAQVCLAFNGSTPELEAPSSITQDGLKSLISLPEDQLPSPLDVEFQENREIPSSITQDGPKRSIALPEDQLPSTPDDEFQENREIPSSSTQDDSQDDPRILIAFQTQVDQHCSLPKSKRRKVSGDGSDGRPSNRVMRSSKRVRQVVPLSSSNHIPRTMLSWLIDNNAVLLRSKVFYRSRKDLSQLTLAEGRIACNGIKCTCCQEVFTPSKFGIHAVNGRNNECASANIFLKDGRSLLDCQKQVINTINLTRVNHDSTKGTSHQGENDDLCTVCHYGGDLVLCDACPSAFHISCLGLEDIPDGDWFCQSCCCRICRQCTIKEDTEHLVDDAVDKFFNCDQCNKKYHLGCLMTQKIATSRRNARDSWFCSKKCGEIFNDLKELIGKSIPVGGDNLTWRLLKPEWLGEHASDACVEELAEIYNKLSVALEVMHECFEPVKDPYTERDLVEDVIFNRESELNRLNFKGFYTVLLERNDELITVASVRVHGEEVAEIPLIGTRFQHRRNGMCRILMNELEKKLEELGVERLVLPAVPGVLNTWTTSFGYSKMSKSERYKFLGYNFLDFQDTFMCQKLLKNESSPESSLTGQVVRPVTHGDRNGIKGSNAVSDVFQAEQIEGVALDQGPEEFVSPPSDIEGCKGDDYRISRVAGKKRGYYSDVLPEEEEMCQ